MKSVYLTLFLLLTISGCSTPSANYALTYYDVDNTVIQKKSFNSDQQLLLSLLNRPMTADMKMMTAFTQPQTSNNASLVNYVSIQGPRGRTEHRLTNNQNPFMKLVYQDSHAIMLKGAD